MKPTEARVLPDEPTIDFVICDNSVNRYGWRLLVAGIDNTGFLKNPVCLVQHDTGGVPVGRWQNLHIDGEEFKGTVLFDRNDPEAIRLYWKYKDGFMHAVSLNIFPQAESESAELMLPGQRLPTVTQSELLEISLVALPGQRNAVRLSTPEGTAYQLGAKTKPLIMDPKTPEETQAEINRLRGLAVDNMLATHHARGVISTDGEKELLRKLALADYESVAAMLSARKPVAAPAAPADTKAKDLVGLHVQRGALSAADAGVWEESAKRDYEATRLQLEAKPGRETVQQFMRQIGNEKQADERAAWGYLDYFKKDPAALELMAKEAPDKLKQLEADFEAESRKLGICTTRDA